jgi:UDP-glucose 4-epimerase
MKILITGVAGFIGSKVANYFSKNGCEVTGVDDLSQGYFNNVPNNIKFIKYDLSSYDIYKKLPKDCDYILHIAGQSSGEISFDDPVSDLNKNTQSTLNLIKYGIEKKVKKILYASSMSVYGDVPDMPIKEDYPATPISCYGVSKLTSERYLEIFKDKLPYLNLRMFNVYGPGQDLTNLRQGMVSIFLAQAIDDGRIHVKGNLNRFRDFIYIDDVVEAWYKLSFNNTVNSTINLGTGTRTTIEELLLIIKKNFKNIDYYSSGSTPGDQKGIYADNSLCKNLINIAQFTKLEDGIRLFCDSIK